MYKLGAHLSIAGGYNKALERIKNIDGNCLQIFSTSPRGWSFVNVDDIDIQQFVSQKQKLKIDPIYFHASYLINLADDGKIGHLSKLSLISELNIAPKLKIKGSIIHLGSFKLGLTTPTLFHDRTKVLIKSYETLIINIKEILKRADNDSLFIIENAGNRKIGNRLEEIAQIVKDVNDNRVRVCLDTCHLYSAGYDISTKTKLEIFLADFEKKIGLNKLELWHVNDSRDPFASLRDRHQNIGQGTIGLETFKTLLNHPKTKNIPFIIETPGFKDEGPDKKNLDILKSMIDKL